MTMRLTVLTFSVAMIAATTAGCRQPQSAAVDVRETELRLKEYCAGVADRFDPSVTEVFYSPVRNSCVCEVNATGESKRAKYGVSSLVTLYDCLTREELGEYFVEVGAPDYDLAVANWEQKKRELKAAPGR